jgi:O-antigen/teichoic acid export membrane protein
VGVIKRQGIKNTIITYIGVIIGAINVIFIQPRLLTEEELGLTRLLYDFSYLIGMAVPLGIPNIIVKYFPFFKNRDNGHNGFSGFVLLVFFIGFTLSASLLLIFKPAISSFYAENSELFVSYFLFIIPLTFIVSALAVTTAYCQSLFKSTVPSFLNDIFVRVGVMLITIAYYNRLLTFDQYVYSFIGIYGCELLIIVIFILQVDRISFRPQPAFFKKHGVTSMLSFGLLLCLSSFASFALRKVDSIILGTYSLSLVGVYTTAVFIAAFIEVPLAALDRISHTKIADSFAKNDHRAIDQIYSQSVKYLLLLGGLLYIGINACTKYLYEVGRLPESYLNCVNVVYIVAFGALVNVSTGVNSAIMFYSKHFVLATVLMVSSLLLTVILNIVLIPIYGIYGAAISSVGGVLIYNLVKYIFIFIKFKFQPYTKTSGLIVLIITLCTLIALWLPSMTGYPLVNLLLNGAVCVGLFLALIYWLRVAPEIFQSARKRLRSLMGSDS